MCASTRTRPCVLVSFSCLNTLSLEASGAAISSAMIAPRATIVYQFLSAAPRTLFRARRTVTANANRYQNSATACPLRAAAAFICPIRSAARRCKKMQIHYCALKIISFAPFSSRGGQVLLGNGMSERFSPPEMRFGFVPIVRFSIHAVL